MRLLGIDYGVARIGLAFTDTSLDMILPLDAIDVRRQSDPIQFISDIVKERQIDSVVVGMPLGLGSSETTQSIHTRSFVTKLDEAIGKESLIVDESFSSVEAGSDLPLPGSGKGRSDGRLDSASACVILRRFLNGTV